MTNSEEFSIPISEIFYSIQGEGILVGVPSIFIRVSYCNLRCKWCDTPYTSWQPESRRMTFEQIRETVDSFHCDHIVITGGEPFLYTDLPHLCQILEDHHITIETNATRYLRANADLISMSPKLSSSTPPGRWHDRHERTRLQVENIRRFLQYHNCQVKFVVDTPDDAEEIRSLIRTTPIPAEKVLLMPQARRPDEIRQRENWLIDLCKRDGYRYSPRLHIELWGNERGR